MKNFWKVAAVVLLALAGVQAANAQFRFGLKAGVNLNSLKLNDFKGNFNDKNGCGFTGGVMTEFTVPLVGICVDASLMYTHMSATADIYAADENGALVGEEASAKNFFNIPINLKYRFGMVPVVKPFIFTGPDFAFKLSGDSNVLKTKTFQCAWNIGIGAEILNHVQIAGSYGFGINNIAEKLGGVNVSDDFKLKNNYWTITLAYLF
ncbi:MAG: porin family protein [Bacteroidales bacterium]|nr:porin family protein [Bacteroidales bacterium]